MQGKKKEGVKFDLLRNATSVVLPRDYLICKNSQSIYLASEKSRDDVTFKLKRGFAFTDRPVFLPEGYPRFDDLPHVYGMCGKTPTDGIVADDCEFLLCFKGEKGFVALAVVKFIVTVYPDLSKHLVLGSVVTEHQSLSKFLDEMQALANVGKKRPSSTPIDSLPCKEPRVEEPESVCSDSVYGDSVVNVRSAEVLPVVVTVSKKDAAATHAVTTNPVSPITTGPSDAINFDASPDCLYPNPVEIIESFDEHPLVDDHQADYGRSPSPQPYDQSFTFPDLLIPKFKTSDDNLYDSLFPHPDLVGALPSCDYERSPSPSLLKTSGWSLCNSEISNDDDLDATH